MTTAIAQVERDDMEDDRYWAARRALSLVWAAHKILDEVAEGPALTSAAAVELSERVGHLMELAEIEIEGLAKSALEDADRALI